MAADEEVTAYIGPAVTVQGSVSGEGMLRVAGTLDGDLAWRGHVMVTQTGSVKGGRLEVTSARVDGRVRGDIHATGRVDIGPEAKVDGEVAAGTIVQHGANNSGRGFHTVPAGPPVPRMPQLGRVRARVLRAEVGHD
jgi:cytoskeletal protein CcmA (bactofilin family)